MKSIKSSVDAANAVMGKLHNLDHEESWGIFLNNRGIVIKKEKITMGTLTSTMIDRRRMIKMSLELNATGLILVHNHPSGDPYPSKADIRETEELRKCCDLFDISLVDHIIICDSRFFSFAEDSVQTL